MLRDLAYDGLFFPHFEQTLNLKLDLATKLKKKKTQKKPKNFLGPRSRRLRGSL